MGQELVTTSRKPAEWADDIKASWSKAIKSADLACQYAIETGQKLLAAKADLKHGDFAKMISSKLPFSPRKAQSLMQIASRPELTNATSSSHLPKRWTVLKELSLLKGVELQKAISYTGPKTTPGGAREIVRIVKGRAPAKQSALKMLPSPKEAKEIARKTGNVVLASDGNYWGGTTEEEQADYERRSRNYWAVETALEKLAECMAEVTPKQWLAESDDYWFIEGVDLARMDAAIKWLTELRPLLAASPKLKEAQKKEAAYAAKKEAANAASQ